MDMKRMLSATLSLSMALLISGCRGDSEDKPESKNEAAPKNNTAISVEGCELSINEDDFKQKTDFALKCSEDSSVLNTSEKFTLLGGAYEVSNSKYDGTILGTDVILTVDVTGMGDSDLERLFFVYYDESNGKPIYMEPKSVDIKNGKMSIALPHFSLWAPVKLTEKEEVELFLDRYSSKLSVAQAEDEKAFSALEPYVRAKLKALELTEGAETELVHSVISEISGDLFDEEGELAAAAWKSIGTEDGGKSFNGKCNDIIADKCTELLEKLGTENPTEIFGAASSAAKFAGYLTEGDFEDAGEELGSMLADSIPHGDIAMKAIEYVGAKVNESFTNWKANEVEELYRIYQKGAEDIWGNEVVAGDWDSLRTYLNTCSGFTKAKAVNRFYNMDKVAEICEKYGWDFDTYEELPEKYKAIFDQRAEDGLKNYFETRLRQEAEAEKIKANERECIETMLENVGALKSGYYTDFFKDGDCYCLSARLERLMKVRAQVSQYIDEAALEQSRKNGGFNYGDIMNWWVIAANEHMGDRNATVKAFCETLKEYELLMSSGTGPKFKDIAGSYSGTVTLDDMTVSDEGFALYTSEKGNSEFGADMTQAECDEALDGLIQEGSIKVEPTVRINADDAASGKCTVIFTFVGDEVVDYAFDGTYSGGVISLDTGNGITSRITVKQDSEKITLSGSKTVLGLKSDETGDIVVLYAYMNINVEK